jgi:RNA polymerase sigma factor (sigma-70 family)
MANALLDTLLGYLRRLNHADIDHPSDATLLRRFLGRDESAFAVLLSRHGPMVLSVCRRLLRQEQEAEDAFQATFLVLANKARSLTGITSVGGWLHGVAVRVSRKARTRLLRRQRLHQKAIEMAMLRSVNRECEGDLVVALDEELDRLPSRYKQPLILCHLESKTVEEASRELGWNEGTVRGLLYRGRELLRKRLARRGLTPMENEPAGGCPPVPAGLVQATLTSAVGLAQGSALVAGPAVVLAQGVLHAMMRTRVIVLAGTLSLVGMGAVGALALAVGGDTQPSKDQPRSPAIPDEGNKPKGTKTEEENRNDLKVANEEGKLPSILKAKAMEEVIGDDQLTKLLKRRYNESLAGTAASYQRYLNSTADGTLERILNSARRLVTAGVEVYPRPQDKLAFLKQMNELSTYLQILFEEQIKVGRAPMPDGNMAREFNLEVEIMILRTKGK